MPSFWDGWESWSFTFRPHKQQERGLSGCAIESLVSNYYSVIGGRYSTLTCFVKVNGATKIVDANRIVDGVYILSCGHHFNNWGPLIHPLLRKSTWKTVLQCFNRITPATPLLTTPSVVSAIDTTGRLVNYGIHSGVSTRSPRENGCRTLCQLNATCKRERCRRQVLVSTSTAPVRVGPKVRSPTRQPHQPRTKPAGPGTRLFTFQTQIVVSRILAIQVRSCAAVTTTRLWE